ncbi:hypothetical protein GCM10010498_40790 [Streptomyces cavourensis]|nr:hypothetical protein GCM10010498_40790 [Streptomyces cavourensis]
MTVTAAVQPRVPCGASTRATIPATALSAGRAQTGAGTALGAFIGRRGVGGSGLGIGAGPSVHAEQKV